MQGNLSTIPLPKPLDAQLRDYASMQLAGAIACLSWRGARLHTGVHQARKSLRRARAVLALGMPALGPGANLIDRQLRRVNRSLSKLRDAQALITSLDHLLERKADDPETVYALRRVRRSAARARAGRARAMLAKDPQLQRRRALLTTLLAALAALQWNAINTTNVDTALQRSRLRSQVAGTKAHASGHDEDWHHWRRRARRLSQQLRALGDAASDPLETEKRGKRLAILLGEAQDYAMVRERCGHKSPFTHTDRRVLRALADKGIARLHARIAKLSAIAP